MKRFRLMHYQFYREKSETNPPRIFVVSDLHFSYQVTTKKLNSLIKFAKTNRPDYIFIPGDLIDSNDMINTESEQNRLLMFLEKLSKVAPVLLSFGNHDFYETSPLPKKTSAKKSRRALKKTRHARRWQIVENATFREKINLIENLHLLDNSAYEDDRIFALGLTLPADYYNLGTNGKKHGTLLHPATEDKTIFLDVFNSLDKSLTKNLPKNKLKFLLVHSPVCLPDPEVKTALKNFDYFISGHLHNGVVPPILDELWPGTRGIFLPTRQLFTKNMRNTIKTSEDKSIIVGAVTTFHECVGAFHHLNVLFPSHAALLEFSADETLKDKPKIKKSYHKFPK